MKQPLLLKNLSLQAFFLFSFLVSALSIQAQYCTSNGGTSWEYISGVTLNGSTQSSGKNGYADYTSSLLTSLPPGSSYPFSIQYTIPGGMSGVVDQVGIYIDFNNDGDFVDGGENVHTSGNQTRNGGTHTFTGSISIPAGPNLGNRRMRVVLIFKSTGRAMGPCQGNYGSDGGETEDYTVNIGPAPSPPSISITAQTNVSCNGAATGSLTATASGGTPNYSYSWTNGSTTSNTSATTNTISSLSAGSYTVTVTDNNGLTATASATITQPTALMASAAVDSNASCNGAADGGATANGSGGIGPYTYAWSNGANTASIAGVAAGTYNVTVTDNNLCTAVTSVVITEPALLTASVGVDNNASCASATDGGLTATPSGGTGPYTYMWGNGATTASISGVGMGTYSVTITDNNGCTAVDSATVASDDVTPPTLMAFNITSYFNNGPGIATLSGYNLFTFGPTKVSLPFNDPIPLGAEIERVEIIMNVNYPMGTGTATNEVYIGGTLIGSTTVGGSAGNKSYTLTYDTVPPGFVYGGSNTFELISTVNPVYFKSTSIRLYYKQPNCEAYAFVPPLIAFDNCAVASITNDYNGTSDAADIYPIGVTTVNWTVTDNSGNVANTSQTVTVIDNEEPEAYARDLTVYLDATGSATITAAQIDSGSTDVCGIDTITLSKYTFSCVDTGDNNISLTALDPHGNSENASAVVTVIDTLGPTAVAQNITAYLDTNGQVSITAADLDNGSSDNCGIDTLILSQYDFTCTDAGINGVRFKAYDANGFVDSTMVNVTVVDTLNPVPVTRNLTVYLDTTGAGSITAAQADSATTDNCAIDTLILSQYAFDCSHVGNNTITFRATDVSANADSTTFTVTVLDTIVPGVAVQNINVYLDVHGDATITAADVDNGTADACGIDTLVLTQYAFDCSHVGANTVNFTATDNNGNIDSATATITVLDTVNPALFVQNLTVYLDGAGTASITAADADSATTDACGIDTLTISQYAFDCSHVGSNSITFTAKDVNGNMDSTTFTVMVMDTTKPNPVAQNLTVFLDATGAATILATDADNGTTDNCAIDTLILSQYAFDCSHVGSNSISFTAIDASTNTDSTTFTVTVVDTIRPSLAVQNLTVYLDATGAATITAGDVDNGTADACGIDTLILSQYAFDCSHVGANTVNFTATDNNGNTNSITATITIMDTISPALAVQNLTIYLDGTGMASITTADADNGTADACGIDTLTISQYDFDCSHVGSNTITFTAKDVNGNADSTTFTVMVMDTLNPIVATQNLTVYLDATGAASIVAADVDNGTTDNCGIDTLILSQYAFDCSHVGANTINFTATDDNGNTASTTATITVVDSTSPAIAVQNLTVYLDATGAASITANDANNGTADNCAIDTLILSQYNFDCNHVGNNTISFTANDVNGNTANTTFTVMVVDTVNPAIAVQNLTVYLDGAGVANITAADVDNGTAAACGMDTLTLSQYAFDCSHAGANVITFTATDVNGNIDSASATITVMDTIRPTPAAQNLTVYLDATGAASITAADADNGTNDNCGIDTLILSQYAFDCSHVGSNIISFTANDVNANTATNTFTVMVMDTTQPSALAQNLTVYLDATGAASITAADADNGTSDNCTIDTLILSQYAFDCTHVGSNTLSFTANDVNGNTASTTFNVLVMDTLSPAIAAQNLTVYLDATGAVSITAADADNGTADACGMDTLVLSQYAFDCSHVGSNTIRFTASDVNGNIDSTTFIVMVMDTLNPILATQNLTVYLDATGAASITAADANTGTTDNCGIDTLILSQYAFDCSHVGSNTISFTANDVNGNSASTTFAVMVIDTILPVVGVQNLTVYLDATGTASITTADVDNGTTDACGIDTLILSQYAFDCSHVGSNTINFTATDNNGNIDSATAIITIMDTISPALAVQNITISLTSSGSVSITHADIDNGSLDACGIDTIILDKYNFTCTDLGPNTVSFTATDVNGNISITSATVTIIDTAKPAVLTQDITVYLDASGAASITAADVNVGTSAGCGIDTLILDKYNFACADLGPNSVTLTAVSAGGATASAPAIVTVVDTILPKAKTKNITVYLDNNGTVNVPASAVNNGSSDNCAYTLSLSQSTFSCSETGLNLVKFWITDADNNQDSAEVFITVKDTISPALHLVNKLTVTLNQFGQATIAANQLDSASTDNCANLLFYSASKTTFTCADLGSNVVSVSVYDNKNNHSTGTAIVEVQDMMAPVVNTVNSTVYLDASGQASISTAQVNNNTTDNCAIDTMWLDISSFSCADIGQNTIKLYAKDQSGNTAQSNAVITVRDTMGPQVITQNSTLYLDANGNASLTAADVDNGSVDNCWLQSMSLSKTNFGCADVGPQTVTLSATDTSGNTNSATATITIMDTLKPVVLTQNVSLSLDANGNATLTASAVDNGSTDACGIQTMSVSQTAFDCTHLGANTITLTVTDNNGNIETGTATVTVIDAAAPTVLTQNITVYLDANGDATITPADVDNGSSDNCGIVSSALDISVFDCADLGQNLVILTATDASNNSASKSAYVTVLDTSKPVLSALPTSITVYTQPGQCVANVQWPAITATDNCVVTTISTSSANGSLFPKGTTAVQVTAIDGSANTVMQSFNVIVLDTISPVVSNVPVNFSLVANATSCDAQVTWNEPIATDNCGSVTWIKSHLPGTVFPVGTTTVTYTATDVDNNSTTVSFAVVVTDNVAPILSNVPANITVNADKGSCDAVVNFTTPTMVDNCSNAVLTSSHTSGSLFPAGVTTVSFTATDAGNNVTTASFTVTVEDKQKPVISSMPANDTIGICSASYTYAKPVATDNCSAVTVTQISGLASGSLFPAGITINSFLISDANGNDTTVSFAVVVVPQGLPALPGTLELCEQSPAVDLAQGQNMMWTGQGIVNRKSFNPGVAGAGRHKLDYTFTDKMGCAASGTIYITVLPQPVKPVVSKVGSHTLGTAYYSTYQWYRDGVLIPGATAQTYAYTLGGNYQVVVGNTSGCNNHSDGFVVGQSGGGIGLEENSLSSLNMYPNPTNGVLTIDLNQEQAKDVEVVVFNIAGKKVLEQKETTSAQGKMSIDLSHLPDATYMVRILSGSESVIKRVVVY